MGVRPAGDLRVQPAPRHVHEGGRGRGGGSTRAGRARADSKLPPDGAAAVRARTRADRTGAWTGACAIADDALGNSTSIAANTGLQAEDRCRSTVGDNAENVIP